MRRAAIVLLLLCACGGGAGGGEGDDDDDIDSGPGGDDDASAPDATVDEAGPGPTQDCPFTADAAGFFTLTSPQSDYVVRLPIGYDVDAPEPQRLLVAIHGCGDSAYNFATWGAVPYDLRGTQDYLAISIGGRDGMCWSVPADAAIVTAAIAHVRSCFYVHQKQIVVAGYSSGGMLAYNLAMTDAASYAGALIENSGLSQGVGGNVDGALDAADWKIHVAHSARIMDGSFPIAGVRADRDKMLAHDFPLEYRELDGTHDGTSADWAEYLIPAMSGWRAP